MGSRARPASRREPAAQLVLDMDADDLLEGVLCREAELARAARVEAARPAGNDARDDRVGLATDALRHVVARDRTQGRDLLGDGGGDPWHGQVAARAYARGVQRRRVDQEPDR